MNEDIVARLRRVPERVPGGMLTVRPNEFYQRCQDAADEIEDLRNKILQLEEAIKNPGPNPKFHHAIMKKHRKEWKTLWDAIDSLIKK